MLPQAVSHDVVEVLSGLLELARAGSMTGIVLGASFRGAKYFCDSAGTLHRNPITALGVSAMLTADLERRVHRRATATVL
jgi:hypothetical protein